MRHVDCIIVFGISGAGKTTLCRAIASKSPEVVHIKVSDIIQSITGIKKSDLKNLDEHKIQENQLVFAKHIKEFMTKQSDRLFLIDGHATIINKYKVIPVQLEVVKIIGPSGILLLEASPQVILRRRELRQQDSTALYKNNKLDIIKQELKAERGTALLFANDLGIKIRLFNTSDEWTYQSIIDCIKCLK